MERKSRRKQNNAGMSLIEIVVVVLIIGILSAGAVYGFSYIRSMDASSAAEEITSLLERTRLNTLSAEEADTVLLTLSKEDNHFFGEISVNSVVIDKVQIGGNGLSIKVTNSSGVTTIDSSSVAEFSYQKSNGAFSSDYTKIEVTGIKTSTITLVLGTGRCYVGN